MGVSATTYTQEGARCALKMILTTAGLGPRLGFGLFVFYMDQMAQTLMAQFFGVSELQTKRPCKNDSRTNT